MPTGPESPDPARRGMVPQQRRRDGQSDFERPRMAHPHQAFRNRNPKSDTDKGVVRGPSYDLGMDSDVLDVDGDHPSHPRPRPRARPRHGSSLVALHGAYHVINRRLAIQLREHGISPSEAVVLAALWRYPMATVALIRQATGLRASTLDSLLDRLVAREVIERTSPRNVPREVVLALSPHGRLRSEYAVAALADVEEELGGFIGADPLATLDLVFKGARALGVPGTAADL
jgi:DNA-binding MarR family transcriptional regulator